MKTSRVQLLPIFEDNYVFVIIDEDQRTAVVIDPGEASSVINFLERENLQLTTILLTHHHPDHIGGVRELQKRYSPQVYAPLKNQNQIPSASHYVQEGEKINLANLTFTVMELPGHTLGHVAYWFAELNWLFSGDVLFGLGCGRLFEGTFEQMYSSLQRIKNLPKKTLIYCTHEYTETNLQFCKMLSTLDDTPIIGSDENLELYANELKARRKLNLPSVPLKLYIENTVNPFLLARNLQQFTYLRDLRNKQ